MLTIRPPMWVDVRVQDKTTYIYIDSYCAFMMHNVQMQINILHIPDLILKLCFYTSYFLYNRQNGNRSSKRNRNDNEYEYNFLVLCRYLNLVESERIIYSK